MEISLSPDNEKFLQSQIAAGIYNSINDAINGVINIAISRTTISQERIDEFNEAIEIGLNAYKNGEYVDGDSVIAELRKKYAS